MLEFYAALCYTIFMKFAFWKRKKEEPAPAPPQPALSVIIGGSDLPPDLPDGCEAVPANAEPHGRYVLFSDSGCSDTDLAGLPALLSERSENLLLFRTDTKYDMPAAETILQQDLLPRKIGFIVSLPLFNRLPTELRGADRGERLAAFLLLAETSAAIDFVGEEQNPEPDDAEGSAESLRAFIRFFGEIKASLDREKYSFSFAYACNRVIGVYAEFAAENKAEEIRLFDDFLKSESMALRVAAKERSAVVRLLMRHNFRAPFWLRPVCAAAAAKARARR